MPFYIPMNYPQPWLSEFSVTNLVGGIVAASAVGATAYMIKKN